MNNFKFINLTHKAPAFTEKKEGDLIAYGDKNEYPNYLIDLLNKSPKHSAIINAKLRYMMGGGWAVDTKGDDIEKKAKAQNIINNANPYETLTEVTEKCEYDRLVFGGFAFEVIKNKKGDGVGAIYHVDFAKVRALVYDVDDNGLPKYKYCFLPKWEQRYMKYETASKQDGFREWLPFWEAPEDANTLYYYKPHRPVKNGELDVYPLPEYVAAIGYIDADGEIQNFHASNIKNNFWGGQIVTMNQVFPTEEEQNNFVRQFKAQKTGTDNTGEVLFVFANSNEQTVTVTPLVPSDLDKQFAQLNEQVRAEIFSVHNVTTPLLFGIRSDSGFGGNKDEMQTGYELFYSTYIVPKQNTWESIINYIYSFNGFGKVFSLKSIKPISYTFSEALLTQLVPREALKKLAAEQLNIDLSSDIVQFSKDEKDEVDIALEYFESVGEYYDESDIVKSYKVELNEDGNPTKDNFQFKQEYFAEILGEVLDKTELDILSAIKSNPKVTAPELAQAFDLELAEVENILSKLSDAKLITGKIGESAKVGKKAEKELKEEDIILRVQVKYRYSDFGAPALKSKSRKFCDRLMGLSKAGKLYTREEIEGLNNSQRQFNNVWLYRGGWYHNPVLDETTKFCRHHWEAVVVKTKG